MPNSIRKARKSERILTEVQETIAELAGDMIVNGCHQYALSALVYAVLAHQWGRLNEERDWCEDDILRYMKGFEENWSCDLTRAWPPIKEHREDPLPTQVQERFRASIRAELAELSDSFAKTAQMEDVFLAVEVLRSWENHTTGPRPHTSCHLADAFARQIEARAAYIRVPNDIEPQVRDYLRLLSEQREKAAAA